MTDFFVANDIHLPSLRTLGAVAVTGDLPKGAWFSCSHPGEWTDPATGEAKLVNWVGQKTKDGSTLYMYTMGADRVRRVVGSVKLAFQPYSIHSIAVAGDVVAVTVAPVALDFLKTGATLCLSCSIEDHMATDPTRIYVFSLVPTAVTGASLDSDTPPVASVVVEDAFFVMHHMNAKYVTSSLVLSLPHPSVMDASSPFRPSMLTSATPQLQSLTTSPLVSGTTLLHKR